MSSPKLSELFKVYLAASDLQESSKEIKSRAFGYFYKLFPDCELCKITYGHAEDYRNWLAKGRSKTSANIYLKNIRPFFEWLNKRGYISQNPFAGIKCLVVEQKRFEIFKPDEIERMLQVSDNRWQAIILLGLCGLRRSEVLNLTIEEIHFDESFILVKGKKAGPATWEWEIKNHLQAIVSMPQIFRFERDYNLHSLLYNLIAELPAGQPYVILKAMYYLKLISATMSSRQRNCPWPNFSRDFRCLLKRAKVSGHKRYQDLRATAATTFATHGFSLAETQRLLRHSSPVITAKYYLRLEELKLVQRANKCYATNV